MENPQFWNFKIHPSESLRLTPGTAPLAKPNSTRPWDREGKIRGPGMSPGLISDSYGS